MCNINYLKFKLTRLKFIRIVLYIPFLVKHYLGLFVYQFTKDKAKIKSFYNLYEGKRCFILGNGPSLSIDDLNLLKNEITFGFNSLFMVYNQTDFRPNYYMAADYHFFQNNKKVVQDIIEENKSTFMFFHLYKKYIKSNDSVISFFHNCIYKITPDSFRKKSVNPKPYKYISMYYSVVCMAIELAFYMGFKNIFLLGIDFSQSNTTKPMHFYKETSNNLKTYMFFKESMISCYSALHQYAIKNNINIYNASRQTELTEFPLISLDTVLSRGL